MLELQSSRYLAAMLKQEGWQLSIGPAWAKLSVPTYADVRYVAKHYKSVILGSAESGLPIYFEYGEKLYLCQLSSTGELMNIQIDGLVANRALLNAFGEILSNPDRSMGLVRISDERQISVSGGSGGRFLINKSAEQATKQYRADYWHPEDLLSFNQRWRQEMSIGGDWFEASYRCFDTFAEDERLRSPNFCNNRFVTRYRLIEGPRGEMFHLCENLDVVAI